MLRTSALVAVLAIAFASTSVAESVDEVLAKYYKARGGLDKIASVQTMRMTAKAFAQGMEAPVTIYMKRPNMMRTEFTVQGMTGIQAYDGTHGWMVMPFMGKKDPEQLSADDVKEVQEQADIDGPLVNYKEKGNTVELVGKESVEGTDAYKLKVTLKDGSVRYVYLDAEEYLEIRTEGKRNARGRDIEFVSSASDYKTVEGLMIPFAMEVAVKGTPQKQRLVIEKVELNVPLADSLFLMPPGTAPAAAPDTTSQAAPGSDTSTTSHEATEGTSVRADSSRASQPGTTSTKTKTTKSTRSKKAVKKPVK
jgi:outer membrane lipoprotein-sorting protein